MNLKFFNSFKINTTVKYLIKVYNDLDLIKYWKIMQEKCTSVLFLGQGTNVLFLDNYYGAIIINKTKGIKIKKSKNFWHLHVNAGELWHNVVYTCMKNNIPGLENMALIPGLAGSAPIQNVGAYGLEFKNVCEYVDILELKTGIKKRLSNSECLFKYRDSIFKSILKDKCVIVSVGIKLSKIWHPNLNHSDLLYLKKIKVSPLEIYHIICNLRKIKLPNPYLYGSCGSFFKNPTINLLQAKEIISKYQKVPYYIQSSNEVRISASWLIRKCKIIEYRVGDAEIYKKQPIILVNTNKATGKDIIKLASYIYKKVKTKFSISLEPEIRIIGKHKEINFSKLI